jgi:cytochrome c2
MLALPGFAYSRLVLAFSAALGVPIALVPHLLRGLRAHGVAFSAMGVAVAAACLVAFLVPPEAPSGTEEVGVVAAGSHSIRITTHPGLVDPGPVTGGGIDRFRDHLVVSNSVGDLYRVWLDESGSRAERLGPSLPLGRDEFVADVTEAAEDRLFRVMDLLVDSASVPPRILLSHYAWHPGERCVTIRVSATAMPDAGGPEPAVADWATIFDSSPCVPFGHDPSMKLTNHAGGRMVWAPDGRLMVSVGDMLYEPRLPQDPDADYGKILLLNEDGTTELYSLGHRNPEGLTIARNGTIWATEHGPRGGDELNRILPGRNYGWPFATYGTLADQSPVPLSEHRRDHGPYEAPVHAWMPSVGISSLVELGGREFPDWEGDLLVASLNGRSVFRIRLDSVRAVYSERIEVGYRIRDLVEDPEGRLILYADSGELITIDRVDSRSGQVAFAIHCARCHEPAGGGAAAGPDLDGVFGRTAASVEDWPYSDALRGLESSWNEENLERFLADPEAFAPGTAMVLDQVGEADRRAIVEYLRDGL